MGLHTSMLKAHLQSLLVGELRSHKLSSRAKKKKKKKLLEENIFATLEYTKILLTGQKKALTIGKNG